MLMKNDKYNIDDLLQDLLQEEPYDYSTEDFYSPFDYRVLKSYVADINGGDNFTDFCEEFFEMLDENDYWES